ncbi:MAG: ATP-binding cassette domain-containing protein [Erysipelotrichaceae bacterium]|jgi:oligopeptide transport system ATP-binding protein|nr:ATP-binding cassette domain-containing protein [Erysipelotrichaceae bacterium]
MSKNVVLSVRDLKQYFRVNRSTTIKAVDGVSFDIYQGETFAVVGESGSGKTTLGRSLIRIYDPLGDATFLGEKITGKLSKAQDRNLRQNMQMIFQDPMASLNPRRKIIDTVAYGLDIYHRYSSKEERRQKVVDVLHSVGLSDDFLERYPHQFSGGQRQRIGVARAIIMEPKFIIADEIISALDVSIQAQVINLMRKLQVEHELTYMFIAHDLSMVRSISDRVAVMHLGHIVELGTVNDIYEHPVHPYTQSLLSSIPHPDPILERTRRRKHYVKGEIDYNTGQIKYLNETHFVLSNDAEFDMWTAGDYSASLQ